MGRRRQKQIIYEKVEILETAAEGKSLARIEDKVLFVPQTVPGDIVDVQIGRKRRRFLEGRVVKFHKYSDQRVEPKCEHFGVCGGCKWQFLSYTDQLANKQKWVKDSLERIGKIEAIELRPIVGSEKTEFYRNKLEFTFSNKAWITQEEIDSGEEIEKTNALGFHIPGRFDKILDIQKCWLQADPSNEIRQWVKAYAEKNKLSFFDLREQTGLLRNLIIRNTSKGEIMVIFSFAQEDQSARVALLKEFKKQFPSVTSLMYVINEKRNDTIQDQDIECFAGRDHIFEEMIPYSGGDPLQFKIGPKSFYQTNSNQAEVLYKLAADLAEIKKDQVVYDLYTGTGTIANYIAKEAKKVVGIEYVEDAIVDARLNSKLNGIENSSFYAGDMKDVFTADLIQSEGKADVVITDPPRAGMHTDVIDQLLASGAEKIVYISCNPATQARDIQLLKEKYESVIAQPVDMFPHTHHVENIVLLKLK